MAALALTIKINKQIKIYVEVNGYTFYSNFQCINENKYPVKLLNFYINHNRRTYLYHKGSSIKDVTALGAGGGSKIVTVCDKRVRGYNDICDVTPCLRKYK